MDKKWYQKSYRRSLVDMHIEDCDQSFLSEFSPDAYVEYLKTANIDSAMIYLQSHVGLCHYPTKSGVVCQNFLFECDYLTKEEQEELIQKIEKYTYRIVWSGNRSYHIVVRLNTPVVSTKYKEIWYYLQNRILKLTGADEQANLPNKYTRVPGQINPKTGNVQTLYSENKYEFNLAEILEDLPRLGKTNKPISTFKGKVTLDALKRHIKRQDWSEGNRFGACQKLSPALITQVSIEELFNMIPCRLEKDHKQVIRAKYHYWEKYNSFCESSE